MVPMKELVLSVNTKHPNNIGFPTFKLHPTTKTLL